MVGYFLRYYLFLFACVINHTDCAVVSTRIIVQLLVQFHFFFRANTKLELTNLAARRSNQRASHIIQARQKIAQFTDKTDRDQ